MKYGIVALVMSLAMAAACAAPVEVVSVQLPAWMQRGERSTPLTPGMELRADDVIRTGAGARVRLRLEEGSTLKLGENANLRLGAMGTAAEDKNLFKAALGLVQGAFRFTTDKLAPSRRREVQIRIATVTAGIRGTDLWGKAAADQDIVCLIEGRVDVEQDGRAPLEMRQPLTYYAAPKNAAPALAPVKAEQLGRWAQETEMSPGAAIVSAGGRWRVQAVEVDTEGEALSWYDNLRNAGYPAVVRRGKGAWRVRIGRLADRAAAETLAARLKSEFNLSRPSVSRGSP